MRRLHGRWPGSFVSMAFLGVTLCAVAPSSGARAGDPPAAARFHLGTHGRKVTTTSPQAQQAFDRGLVLAFAFNHRAAEAEFRKAAEADPSCAMAWWGIALVNGPHINLPLVLPENAKAAWEALGKARAASAGAGEAEQALIAALSKRYADPQPEDRRPLDEAYAAAMREVARTHPQDADVATLAAEALMDLRPWDLWTADGSPQPGTDEVLALLERAMALDCKHPGALHLWIHAVEASPHPERGVAAADALRDLVPGAGHLVHMPAHVYARVGRWAEAAAANERAIEADAWYRTQHPNPGFYVIYMAHNHHFLAFTAMMRGRSEEAIRAARAMVAGVPADFLAAFAPVADGFMIFPSEVLMRFGRWEDVLKEPEPAEMLPLSRALWRWTRTVALNALGRAEDAAKEREAFRAAEAKVPPEWTFGNNPASALLAIAERVVDGEIASKAARFDDAVKLLREAVDLEAKLRYDEPPDWIQPVRHTLGAVLVTAGRYAEAETVYREDLVRWPENAWALLGLSRSLHHQGKHEEAMKLEPRLKAAWKDADVHPTSTCYCQPGK